MAKVSIVERFLIRLVETLFTYTLIAFLGLVATASFSTGHFPPTKQDLKDQVGRIQNLVQKSEQTIEGLKTTNEQLASLGPQLQGLGLKMAELDQKVQALESELQEMKLRQLQRR